MADLKEVDFVIEAVLEDLDLKKAVFKELNGICRPEVILATNTSVMSPTQIASKSQRRERILGTHWWNPPFLIPLVGVEAVERHAGLQNVDQGKSAIPDAGLDQTAQMLDLT